MRELKFHEKKPLKKVNFLEWKSEEGHRETQFLQRYHVTNPMASRFVNFSLLVFVCSLIVGGNCQPCTLNNLKIAQGKISDIKWKVTITNDCRCSQLDVKLSCDRFQPEEPIHPSILSKSGGECLVNNGRPIYGNKNFNFVYASTTKFPFKPLSSHVACPLNERCLERH